MYLKRLEMQGFKTFAQKTVLEFMPDASGRRGITAIVGPNGSGKSNAADAIRWVMGEQSLKLLRGKKSEDVIFSGSGKRARSGFAEVAMTIENDQDSKEVDLCEIAVTRRLYRDGQSEYEINRQSARLQDVVMLLAQCGVGQRTYSVIGQGMVDAVLVASPLERKEFFDEAFGLRPFQLKRQSALHKIDASREALVQTEGLLREIEPRLHTLTRQVNRLQEREALEAELRSLERAFYGSEWQKLAKSLAEATRNVEKFRQEQAVEEKAVKKVEDALAALEEAAPVSEEFRALRAELDALAEERSALRERQSKLETKKAVAAARAEQPWAPLPLSKIIESIDIVRAKHDELEKLLSEKRLDVEAMKKLVADLRRLSAELVGKLQRPAPEPDTEAVQDPRLGREAAEIAEALRQLAEKTLQAQKRLDASNKKEEEQRKEIFALQHSFHQKREESRGLECRLSDSLVELAKLETRREGFLSELRQFAPLLEGELEHAAKEAQEAVGPEASARLQKLRSQLEWIGGIDSETLEEHEKTKTRFDFLTKQSDDLRQSLEGLDLVMKELDDTIRNRSEKAFKTLDREFGVFFKKLFNGGEAKLIEVAPELKVDEEGNGIEAEDVEKVAGIEIQATPPGKRFKSIALLSGGERALTSIALICAIMATNPSPFVVLDEVDAALDESNSRKFAEIIDFLADKTQFILVTHNRATMQRANVLYGVTMGDDGVSQLLSVRFEDAEKLKGKNDF